MPTTYATSTASSTSTTSDTLKLNSIVSITSGDTTSYAIDQNGEVWAWGGHTNKGILGTGYTSTAYSPTKAKIDHVKMIASSSNHTLFLKTDGTVWVVGTDRYGQLGLGTNLKTEVPSPRKIPNLKDIISISSSNLTSLALQKDGTVWQWGWMDRTKEPIYTPVKVSGLPAIKQISTDSETAMALSETGQVWGWGRYILGEYITSAYQVPTVLKNIDHVQTLAGNNTVIQENGTVQSWIQHLEQGRNRWVLTEVKGIKQPLSIAQKWIVLADGTLWSWNPAKGKIKQMSGIQQVVQVTNSPNHQLILLENGTVMTWGTNMYGETGRGTIDRNITTTPQPLNKAIQIIVNQKEAQLIAPPVIYKSSTYVPLRGVFEQLGATIQWEQGPFIATLTHHNNILKIHTAAKVAYLNGKRLSSDIEPLNVNYTVMIPLRLVAEIFDAEVKWDQLHRTVTITDTDSTQ